MKIVILNGSPRKGNTMTAIKAFRKGLEARPDAADIEVTQIDTASKSIIPCKACNACMSMSRCIFADDSPEINAAVEEADAVIFATPVYWWGMTAQLKLVVDKFYARASKFPTKEDPKKKIGSIVIGEAELDDPEYEIIHKQIACIADYLNWETVFAKSVSADKPADLAGNEELLGELEKLGAEL